MATDGYQTEARQRSDESCLDVEQNGRTHDGKVQDDSTVGHKTLDGRKFNECPTDIGQKSNDNRATDSIVDATTLQNTRELCSNGGRDTTATAL
ncbi:unnamed protein product [Sphagnum balticum]